MEFPIWSLMFGFIMLASAVLNTIHAVNNYDSWLVTLFVLGSCLGMSFAVEAFYGVHEKLTAQKNSHRP